MCERGLIIAAQSCRVPPITPGSSKMAFVACRPDTTDKMLPDTVLNYSWRRTEIERKGIGERGGGGEERETLKACQSLLIILIAELKLRAKA